MPIRFSKLKRLVAALVLAVAATVFAAATPAVSAAPNETNPYGGTWKPYPPPYASSEPVPLSIPMADGVNLVGQAFYPTDPATGQIAAGQFPVVLQFTPYEFSDEVVAPMATYGYISVQVNHRGTKKSPGTPLYLASPELGQEGARVVHWLASELPQSDGRVGMWGCSAVGVSQIMTAEQIGPNSPLKAIAPASAPLPYGTQDALREAILVQGVSGPTLLLSTALFPPGVDGLQSHYAIGGDQAYDRPTTYSKYDYPAERLVANGVPALLQSGTKDLSPNGTMFLYTALQNAYRGRDWRLPMDPKQRPTGRYQVVLNDGSHCVQMKDITLHLRWFDTWVKGQSTGIENTSTPMHLLEQPTRRWINTDTYPITDDYQRRYLTPGGTLTSTQPLVGSTAPLAFGPPSDPLGTVEFTTAPFATETVLAGGSSATIYASTSSTNLHLVARLQDVAPDGTVTNIADAHGNVVGSLGQETTTGPNAAQVWRDRNGTVIKSFYEMHDDQYLTPGQVRRFNIRIGVTLRKIQPGHSLRLRLSTQIDPADCANVIGNVPCYFTTPQLETLPGIYTLHFGGSYPATLNLPLVDPNSLATATAGVTPTSGTYVQPLDWGNRSGN